MPGSVGEVVKGRGETRVEYIRMKILVIGSGGREHALAWKLQRNRRTPLRRIWCARPAMPASPEECLAGNSQAVECVPLSAELSCQKLLAFAQENKCDLTVVGPDNPLALGYCGFISRTTVCASGVRTKSRAIRGFQGFSQRFMEKYGIPTAGLRGHLLRPGRRQEVCGPLGRQMRRQGGRDSRWAKAF